MTKAEIIDAIYEKVGGFSKKEAAEIVEAVFDSMKDVLTEGQKIKISGFGNFVVRYKKERIGRNPQTGEPIPISARRVLTFKPSQVLKGILNPHKTGRGSEPDGAIPDVGPGGETPAMSTPMSDPGAGSPFGGGEGGGTPPTSSF